MTAHMKENGLTSSLPPKVMFAKPVGAPGSKMKGWATDLAKSIHAFSLKKSTL